MKVKTCTLLMMFVLSFIMVPAQGVSVEPNTNLKVLTGTTLKVAVGDLLLKSDATGDATLIAFGQVTHGAGSKAIVQRYLPGEVSAWHMISAPVNDMTIAGSAWVPGSNEDLFLWHEPEPGIWVNYKNTVIEPKFSTVNPGDNFVTGKGYIVNYFSANPTRNFESSGLNTGNINITLAKSGTKDYTWTAGLNLIGNPYASGLDWDAVVKNGIVSEVYAQIYNYNKTGGAGYEPLTGIIASGQGFFVRAVSDQAVLALQPSHQVHTTTQTFLKQGEDKLVLRLTNGDFFDETTILLHEASAPEHDFYDASKFLSFDPQVPQLYSLATDGWMLAINSMDAISEAMVVPVSIKVAGNDMMSIKLMETKGFFDGKPIILHDVLTNTLHNLSDEPTYYFMASEDDTPERFLLKFGPVGIEEAPLGHELNAYMQHNQLCILNPDAPKATVELYNIHGQVILRQVIGQGLQSMSIQVVTGIYMVAMRTEKTITSRKLFIP